MSDITLTKQDEQLILKANDAITHHYISSKKENLKYNHNSISKMEKELLAKRYELETYNNCNYNNSWDDPNKKVGKKLWQDYLKDKDEKDLDTAWRLLLLQKNDEIANNYRKRSLIEYSRNDRKDLLAQRKVERFVVSAKCNQDI